MEVTRPDKEDTLFTLQKKLLDTALYICLTVHRIVP